MKAHFSALALLALAACGQPAQSPQAPQTPAVLHVESAWAGPTPNGVTVSAGYLTVVNDTDAADRLMAASSPRSASVDLHEMTMDGAVMQMRPSGPVEIPAHGSIAFAPGGRHLMFMGVTQPFAEGERIPVQLTFEHAGAVAVDLPVSRNAPQ